MAWIFSTAMRDLNIFIKRSLETSRPVLIEVVTERFRGHSISDPGLYRSKDDLKECHAARSAHHDAKCPYRG